VAGSLIATLKRCATQRPAPPTGKRHLEASTIGPTAMSRMTHGRGILALMQEKRERWMELAAKAADEQDPEKLSELVREIDQLLAEKLDRIGHARIPSKPSE
jgi:hypothetical protein